MIEIKRVLFFLFCSLSVMTSVGAFNNNEFIPLINAVSRIDNYGGEPNDLHGLVADVINNYDDFRRLTALTPSATAAGTLKMCDAQFIDDVMYRAFRTVTPRPSPDMLTELGYYYSNGFYFCISKAESVSQNDIIEIKSQIAADDDSFFVIYSNSRGDNAICLRRDESGYYITRLETNLDYSTISEYLKAPDSSSPYTEFVRKALPVLVFLVTIAAATVILFRFVLF